ncbi:hypothetical protein ABEB36_014905 [Hypothenemus hampei]|uniref:Uncharacterized protein n=1 Tax=Hypothenemus hampei TaxID=57062 RepID=A0ABD1E3B8_HYPHA
MEVTEKIKEYENFVENKLKQDLKDIETVLFNKSIENKEWTELKIMVSTIEDFKSKDRDMNIHFHLNHDINAFATISDYETTYVDVGLGYLLEMNATEATKYADIRLNLLRKEINHLRQLAVNVKVHIKLALLAIAELQTTLTNDNKKQ